jgi:hypothetical protein
MSIVTLSGLVGFGSSCSHISSRTSIPNPFFAELLSLPVSFFHSLKKKAESEEIDRILSELEELSDEEAGQLLDNEAGESVSGTS